MSNNIEDSVEVPVLELEFDKFLELCQKVNLIDSALVFSMPNHVNSYSNRDNTSVGDLVTELLEYQKPENSWRVNEYKVAEFKIEDDAIHMIDRVIYDASRIIIVSQLNSAYIVPGEQSLLKGNCAPNQIIKLSNLISSQLFLLQFKDVKDEETNKFNLRVEYALINKIAAKKDETSRD